MKIPTLLASNCFLPGIVPLILTNCNPTIREANHRESHVHISFLSDTEFSEASHPDVRRIYFWVSQTHTRR